MPENARSPRKTTADLFQAVKAYCARLPFVQAVKFAAGVWGVSEEEALRRLTEKPPPSKDERNNQ